MTTSTAAGAARDRWLADLCTLHAAQYEPGTPGNLGKLAEAAAHRRAAEMREEFEEARQAHLADRGDPAKAAAFEATKLRLYEERRAARQAAEDAGVAVTTATLSYFTEPSWDEYEGMAV